MPERGSLQRLSKRYCRRPPPFPPPQAGEDKYFQFARVQVCVLQMMLITQPLSSAVFGPVKVNEPV